jgi:hypothetical protein
MDGSLMAVTPNYSWPVPVNTDYVKDGADAIKDLGDAIDATVYGLPSGALALVKTQTIGTAVTSVEVTGAFSAAYDNYLVTINNVVGSVTDSIRVRAGTNSAGYFSGRVDVFYSNGNVSGASDNNGSSLDTGILTNSNGNVTCGEVFFRNPFATSFTFINYMGADARSIGLARIIGSAWHNSATSFTSFTILANTGTLTGGTISVYGYEK